MSPQLEAACRKGLESLDAALDGRTPPGHDPIAGATRGASLMRDMVIGLQRSGHPGAGKLLERANILLSELVAGEFPVSGFRKKRIEEARGLYERLLGDVSALRDDPAS